MADCTGAANVPCQWGLVVLRRPVQSAPVKPAAPVDARADAIQGALKWLRDWAVKNSLEERSYEANKLNSGDRKQADLGTFDTGYEYAVFAFCESCTAINFDLVAPGEAPIPAVEGTRGVLTARGVTVKPTSRKIYKADLHMSGCAADPCRYGIWVGRAAVGSLPTQATPSTPSVPAGLISVRGGLMQVRVDPDPNCYCYRIKVSGQLQNAQGRKGQVAVDFWFQSGGGLQRVPGNPQVPIYVLPNGAARTYLDFNVVSNPFDLAVLSLEMPFSALVLPSRPGWPYTMQAETSLFVDTFEISRASGVPFMFPPP
jgi:hypothetical protein